MRRSGIVNNLDEQLKWLKKSKANIPPKREELPPSGPQQQQQSQHQQQRPSARVTVPPPLPPPPVSQLGQRQGGGPGSTLVLSGQDRRTGITREDSNPIANTATTVASASTRITVGSSSSTVVPDWRSKNTASTVSVQVTSTRTSNQPERTFATPALPQRLNSTADPSVPSAGKSTRLNSSAPATAAKQKSNISTKSTQDDKSKDIEMPQLLLNNEPSAKPGLASSRNPSRAPTEPTTPSSPTKKAVNGGLLSAYKEQVSTLTNIDPNHAFRTPQPRKKASKQSDFASTTRKSKRPEIPCGIIESIDLTVDSEEAGSSTTSPGVSGEETVAPDEISTRAAALDGLDEDNEPIQRGRSRTKKSKSDKSRSATIESGSEAAHVGTLAKDDTTSEVTRKKKKKDKTTSPKSSKSGKSRASSNEVDADAPTISSAGTLENAQNQGTDHELMAVDPPKSSDPSVSSSSGSNSQRKAKESAVIPCSEGEDDSLMDDADIVEDGSGETAKEEDEEVMLEDIEALAAAPPQSSAEPSSSHAVRLKFTPSASPLQIHSPTKIPPMAPESNAPLVLERSNSSSAARKASKSKTTNIDLEEPTEKKPKNGPGFLERPYFETHPSPSFVHPLSAPDVIDGGGSADNRKSIPTIDSVDDKTSYQRYMEMDFEDLKMLEQKLEEERTDHVYEMIRKLQSKVVNANFAQLGKQKDNYDRHLSIISQVARRRGANLVKSSGSQSGSDVKNVVSQRVVVEATQFPLHKARPPSPSILDLRADDSTQSIIKQTQFPASYVPSTPQRQPLFAGHAGIQEDSVKESPIGALRDNDGDFDMNISSPVAPNNDVANDRRKLSVIAESSPAQERTPSPSPRPQLDKGKGKALAAAAFIDDEAGCDGFPSDFEGEETEDEEEEDDIPLINRNRRSQIVPDEGSNYGSDIGYADIEHLDAMMEDNEGDDEEDDDLKVLDAAPQVFRKRCEEQAMSQVTKAPILEKPQQLDMTSAEMQHPWSKEVAAVLRSKFKLQGFRSNQLQAINSILSGQDTFVLMPTGGGKSLCYQLPAVVQSGKTKGLTFVISPLLSLMQDQTMHLQELGIQAVMFNGELNAATKEIVLSALFSKNAEEQIQLLYVTPEMLMKSQKMQKAMKSLYDRNKLARICIDEAHCVSQWGHDFRPEYTQLGKLRDQFPHIPFMALTATANRRVQDDIQHNLKMDGCNKYSQSFNRPNLSYEVLPKAKKAVDDIADLIKRQYRGKTGIIYCLGRKKCEEVAAQLRAKGIAAAFYHAAMSADEKQGTQKDWINGKFKVIVATIAFGMGIDKADVRFVIHFNIPKSLEGYYQETGRAGRDGKHSGCYLFFSKADIKILHGMIDSGEGATFHTIQQQKDSLNKVVNYCNNKQDCRRKQVLQYFNENFDPVNCNKTCDNCAAGHSFIDREITGEAQALVRLVQQIERLDGNNADVTMLGLIDIYRGSQGKKIMDAGYNRLKHFGEGKKWKKEECTRLTDELKTKDILSERSKYNNMGFTSMYVTLGREWNSVFRKNATVSMQVQESPTTERTIKNVTTSRRGKKTSKDNGPDNTQPFQSTNVSSPVPAPRSRSRAATNKSQAQGSYEDTQTDLPDSLGFFPVRDGSKKRKSDGVSGASGKRQKKASKPITADDDRILSTLNGYEIDMLERFMREAKSKREEICNDKSLRVESVFTDTELRKMFIARPTSRAAMAKVQGLDPDRVERHGQKFVLICQKYNNEFEENTVGLDMSQFQTGTQYTAPATGDDDDDEEVEDDEYGGGDDFDDIDPDAVTASVRNNEDYLDDDDDDDIGEEGGGRSAYFNSQTAQDFNQRLAQAVNEGSGGSASSSSTSRARGGKSSFGGKSRYSKAGGGAAGVRGKRTYTKRARATGTRGARGSRARGGASSAASGSRSQSAYTKNAGSASTSRKAGGSGKIKSMADIQMFSHF